MDEFVKMIFNQWFDSEGIDKPLNVHFDEEAEQLYKVLNPEIARKFEIAFNKCVWDMHEKAFGAGFYYACKCLSNGKIELSK